MKSSPPSAPAWVWPVAMLLAGLGVGWFLFGRGRGAPPATESGSRTGTVDVARPPAPWTRPTTPPPTDALRGQITDAATGEPVVGATVLVAGTESAPDPATGEREPHWVATRTGAHGWYDLPFRRGNFAPGAALELRVRADGFRSLRVPTGAGERDLQLVGETAPPAPGRVRGVVHDVRGRPGSGPFVVLGFDEFLERIARWAFADAEGAFRIDGLPPGTWSFALSEAGPWAVAVVEPGGEAKADLYARREWVGVGGGTQEEAAELERKADELSVAIGRLRTAAESQEGLAAASLREKAKELEAMLARVRVAQEHARPHRAVRVTGLGADRPAWIAYGDEEGEWIVEAEAGSAVLPWVPSGRRTFEIRRPGAAAAWLPVEVAAGDGEQTVDASGR